MEESKRRKKVRKIEKRDENKSYPFISKILLRRPVGLLSIVFGK
jgi:hypothetical protein